MTDRRGVQERLAHLVYQVLYPELFPDLGTPQFAAISAAVQELWERSDETLQRRLRRVRADVSDPLRDNGNLHVLLLHHLAGQPDWTGVPDQERHSHVRSVLGFPGLSGEPRGTRDASATEGGPLHDEKEIGMTTTTPGRTAPGSDIYQGDYTFDSRAVPESFDAAGYRRAIDQLCRDRNAEPANDPLDRGQAAYVTGSLLLGSYFEPTSPGFQDAFVEQFDKGFELVETLNTSRRWRQLDVYARVAAEISRLKAGAAPTVQEVSAVTDDLLELGPVDDNFAAKVRSSHDDFVAKTPVFDSLDLPDIVTDDTAQAEVEPANIRAVAMIYATSELEGTQLVAACDQAAQDWSDGVLPVGENAGRLFDAYVWGARDRLDPAARDIQYDRIGELHAYILRFCSATSERDRAQYLSEYLSPTERRPSAQPRDAAVRKTARDLLAYASLHGWAYTQFAAKRLGNQIRECVAIIEHPEVQKAYGVQGAWQVVERIAGMSHGVVPEIAKHRALASTGKGIVDMLATKAKDIAASLPKDPLFPPRVQDNGQRSVFNQTEYEALVNLVESWLAANTVNDAERLEAAQLQEITGSASLPVLGGGAIGSGSNGFDSETVKNQLMQMVSAGQMPTADQVQQFFNQGK